MVISVGTGRDRQDIASAIVGLIKRHRPEYVMFIATQKSKDETIPIITESIESEKITYEIKLISDENDFEKIFGECVEYLKDLLSNFEADEIQVDYTSGTKAMSVGLVLSALELEVGGLSYIHGQRDQTGRVQTGTERYLSFPPNRIYSSRIFREAKRFFNIYRYDSAYELAEKLKISNQNEVTIFKKLCEAYSGWDKFNLKKSFEILKEITESDKDDVLSKWNIKQKLEKHKQILYKELKNPFCEEKMVDLFANAKRRYEEGKYDDSVARLYRLIEYIAQFRISQKGLYYQSNGRPDTSRIDISKLSPEIQEKYRSERLALTRSYELLSDVGDELGKKIYSDIQDKDGKLKALLGIRNKSILAHGFDPIEKDTCSDMMSYVEDILIKDIGINKSLFSEIEFPKLEVI